MKAKVKNLAVGDEAIIVGRIKKKDRKKGDGEPWIQMQIIDNSGMGFANIWQELEVFPIINELNEDDLVEAEVTCTQDGDFTNLNVHSIRKLEEKDTPVVDIDRKSTRLNSSHVAISYAVF